MWVLLVISTLRVFLNQSSRYFLKAIKNEHLSFAHLMVLAILRYLNHLSYDIGAHCRCFVDRNLRPYFQTQGEIDFHDFSLNIGELLII